MRLTTPMIPQRAAALAGLAVALMLTALPCAAADLSAIVAEVEPSVVVVIASKDLPAADDGAPQVQHVFGSGFFISETDVATSASVLDGVETVRVVTANDALLPASIVGVDLLSRVALLRVAEPVGRPVTFSDQSQPLKGAEVFTLGSQFGMGLTVGAGMVNGTDRTVVVPGLPSLTDAFQIDSPVSGDGAGCPVFDLGGRAVGMVLFSMTPEVGAVYRPEAEGGGRVGDALVPGGLPKTEGAPTGRLRDKVWSVVTFCLPADTLSFVAGQLSTEGRVRRGILGVEMGPTPADARAFLGLGDQPSATVVTASEGGPAAQAGLRPHDVVVAVDGQPLTSVRDLVKGVQLRPGEDVHLTLLRGGDEVTLTVHIGEHVTEPLRSPGGTGAMNIVAPMGAGPLSWLGVHVAPVSDGLAAHAGIAPGTGGCVEYVFPGSPAEAAGIRVGDVLTAVDRAGERLAVTADELSRVQRELLLLGAGKTATIRFLRLGEAGPMEASATLVEMPERQASTLNAPAAPSLGVIF